jgi:hypothetical protein
LSYHKQAAFTIAMNGGHLSQTSVSITPFNAAQLPGTGSWGESYLDMDLGAEAQPPTNREGR